jgi:hypothetical protein
MKRCLPLLLLLTLRAFAYDALTGPTELLYWNPAKAQNGYTFFGVGGTTYLIDMEGRVVHTWPVGNNPHLQDDGGVLDTTTNDPSGFGGFRIVDWDGRQVWQYTERRSNYHPHHDFLRIYNPKLKAYTVLYIANRDYTAAECIAAGANPQQVPLSGAQLDTIVEVDASGTVVWEWRFFDHLVQDLDPAKPNHVGAGKTIADHPGRLNINLAGHPLKGDWLHLNSVDYNPALDQVVFNSVQGEFYIVDHGGTFVAGDPTASIAKAATSAGDFLYRFGDPVRYAQGTAPAVLADWTQSTSGTKQLGGAHGVNWIEQGLPGAGRLLIFSNAQYLSEHTPQSYVLEIDPFVGQGGTKTGAYVNPPAAGYTTLTFPAVTDKTPRQLSRQVAWQYFSKSNLTLFSNIGCSAQRLANGNTLVCADTYGYVTEVTPEGETVWDYIMPVTPKGALLTIGDNLPMVNSIFRAYRFTAGHPALANRTLVPGRTVAGRTTVANPYAGTAGYQAQQRATGLQYLDATRAQPGYTLFAAGGATWLIDLTGRVVHTWPTGTNPRLLENGRLLDVATNRAGAAGFKELDWEGNVVWEYYETRAGYRARGDMVRATDPKLNGPVTFYLASKALTAAQCLAAGCDPANGPYDGAETDVIVEIDATGKVLWEWSFLDHGVQDVDATKANYVGAGRKIADFPGRLNLNLPGRPVRAGWPSTNSLDYHATLDQLVVNSEQGEFYVIDRGGTFTAGDPAASTARAATTAGDFLYRFGDPARHGAGSPPSVKVNWEDATNGNKQIGASNNIQWIRPGLPGAGHFLVFNNNQYLFQRTAQSYVFEINPNLNAAGADTGSYVAPPSAGYTTWTFDKDTHKSDQQLSRQVTWKYSSVGNLVLFSHFGSGAQRLPNGNTLICATTRGYLVEVTAAGDIVWEFINPVTAAGIVPALGDCLPMTNAVPRAHRYAADFAGLAGRALTPGKLLAESGAPVVNAARLVNISTRVAVGGAAGTPIPGFVLSGSGNRSMVVRAVGPTLAAFGVTNALGDPRISLVANGATVAANDNWLVADAATMAGAGAFALAAGGKDAALVTALAPGAYTVPVTATDGGTGVVLLEVYAAAGAATSTVVNASTRAYAGTGASVFIVGFVVDGVGAMRCLIRAVGPTLTGLGVDGALADPSLGLYLGPTLLTANDNWSSAANAAEISSAATTVGAFALAPGTKDAALVTRLPAGAYTAVVTGAADSAGTALVEIYVLP